MDNIAKHKAALQLIRSNIERFGHHAYVVSNGPDPRFAYTIGLRSSIGVELILADATIYLYNEIMQIINEVASNLKSGLTPTAELVCGSTGSFTLRQAHQTWTSALILRAFDYFQTKEISALQIIPDQKHWTIDVPDMSQPWSTKTAPAWKWLYEPWMFPVPSSSVAITNLEALRGRRITHVARWETDQWEAFAGSAPETQDEARVVPIGTIIGADASLSRLIDLPIGAGIWRDSTKDWQVWGDSSANTNE
jgi:hypothetical protein